MTADSRREWYGLELMEETGMKSGTLYPLLQRLVADGWLERTREAASDLGGTSRRMYRLTGHGIRSADSLLASRTANDRRRRSTVQPGVVTT